MTTTSSVTRVKYWLQGEAKQNLGDSIAELFIQRLNRGYRVSAGAYRLLGSCIDDWQIGEDLAGLAEGDRVAYWGCGLREERAIAPALMSRCIILGVRGPLTRTLLGLPEDTVLGDPALILPLLHASAARTDTTGHSICIPHFNDLRDDAALLDLAGTERIVRPVVEPGLDSLLKVIDRIATARFVLSASLHGAIVAAAYGRPFAFWDNGHLDLPLKWRDFAASIGVSCAFVPNAADAAAAYGALIRPKIKLPRLSPILNVCPLNVPPSLMLRALAWDGVLSDANARPSIEALEACGK